MKLEFRDLYADEIECRVGTVKEGKGFTLLLYKNARVDMALLDEVVGVGNWQREHKIIGNDVYCRVGIWNEELKQWIWREDAGAEANTEAEKSKASDSFKRACVNFGLGRCLYSSPFIWIAQDESNNPKTSRYSVMEIEYKDHKITKLFIKNDKTGQVVFSYGVKGKQASNEPKTHEKPYSQFDNTNNVSMKELNASVNTMEYNDPFEDSEDRKYLKEYYATLNDEGKQKFEIWLFTNINETKIERLNEEQVTLVAKTIRGKVAKELEKKASDR